MAGGSTGVVVGSASTRSGRPARRSTRFAPGSTRTSGGDGVRTCDGVMRSCWPTPRWTTTSRCPTPSAGRSPDATTCRTWPGSCATIVLGQTNGKRLLDQDDLAALRDVLNGRGLPQRDLIGAAAEREDEVERLSAEQAVILRAARLLNRVEIRGGAGSGKTWLAVEQARRLSRDGQRVALTCYSRGLAAWLERRVAALPRKERPAYVGTFHNLGVEWGAPSGRDDDSDFWEVRLPELMVGLGAQQPAGRLFDAIVVDEAQDFADLWWPAALAALKDEEAGGLYVFSDEGQRVFSRFGGPPAGLVPLVLDQNLRNTRQIARASRPWPRSGCASATSTVRSAGSSSARPTRRWTPRRIRSTCSSSAGGDRRTSPCSRPARRHPEQKARQAAGPSELLGHVLGPRTGLLRPRPRLQGARATGRDPRAQRAPSRPSGPRAAVRRALPRTRPAGRRGRSGVRPRRGRVSGSPAPARSRLIALEVQVPVRVTGWA